MSTDISPALGPPLVYCLDAADRIASLNDAYLHDAAAGGPIEAVREALMGRVLWQVLPQATDWYGPLVRRARADGREIHFRFRCDTPALRRLLRMRIVPDASTGGVCFESTIVGVQPRPPVALLDPAVPHGSDLVTMCSWCKRVEARGEWLEVEDALERLEAAGIRSLPSVTHGVCPRCLDELVALASSPDAQLSIDLPGAS